MKTGFLSSPVAEDLIERVRSGDCILFLGASVHAPPPRQSPYKYPSSRRPPSAQKLTRKMAVKCEFKKQLPDEAETLQRVSLCFEKTPGLGRRALVQFLKEELEPGRAPSPALEMLASLPFKIIVTTNYDHLLEKALRKRGKSPQKIVYTPKRKVCDDFEDLSSAEPLLFKFHGDLSKRKSIVITDEDYIQFIQRMSDHPDYHPVPETVRFQMRRWPTLFVGYSLLDYNLRLLFRTLRWTIDKANFPASYSVDLKPDPLIMKVWQDERSIITFVSQNLWRFVPELFQLVTRKEYKP